MRLRGRGAIKARVILVMLVAWVPLAIFTVIRGGLWSDVATSFWFDTAVHARFLICAPLLMYTRAHTLRRLTGIVGHFVVSGLIAPADRTRFACAIIESRHQLHHRLRWIVIVPLAYATVFAAVMTHIVARMPIWNHHIVPTTHFSTAGLWQAFVSLPLLLSLIYDWFWRLFVWGRLLRRIAHLDLRIVPSHPDHTGGLSFVGTSLRAFSLVALALASLPAGQTAQLILRGLGPPKSFLLFNAGMVAVLAVVFTAPLFQFGLPLIRAWRRGIREYGTVAQQLGAHLERKWMNRHHGPEILGVPDFSATTDFYQVSANVYEMRFVPISIRDLRPLVVAMLLPFIPALMLTVPVSVIWDGVKSVLL